MASSSSGTVRVTQDGRVATILIDNPSRKNAMTQDMFEGLAQKIEEVSRDDSTSVAILTGAGDAFCSGVDLDYFTEIDDAVSHKSGIEAHVQVAIKAISDLDKPIIASMNGAAVGAGFDLALACDIRIAATSARFSTGYIRLGLAPGGGGAALLPRVVGLQRAMDLLFTGRFIDANESASVGLVLRVVPDDDLDEAVSNLAHRIAERDLLALRLTKRAALASSSSSLRTSLDLASSHAALLASRVSMRESRNSDVGEPQ